MPLRYSVLHVIASAPAREAGLWEDAGGSPLCVWRKLRPIIIIFSASASSEEEDDGDGVSA